MSIEKKMDQMRFVNVEPMPAEDMTNLAMRWGGTKPLPVLESQPGVFVSAWAIHRKEIAKMLKKGTPCTLQVVIDTNVPGHPSISLKVTPVKLTRG